MPSILYAGSEGEIGLFDNELNFTIGSDDMRRGSVDIESGNQLFRDFPACANCWIHVRCWQPFVSLGAHVGQPYITVSNGNRELIAVVSDDYDGQDESRFKLKVATANSGTGVTTTGTFPHPIDNYLNYDINLVITGTTLTVNFYRNQVLRYSSDIVDPAGWDAATSVLLEGRSSILSVSKMSFQDVIITDALPTVGMELVTLVPSAVGQFNDFTKDYSAINGPGYDSTTSISTDAAGVKESWILADPTFDLGDKVIYGVVMTTVAQTDISGVVSDFTPFLRILGVEYNNTDLGANSVAPDAYTTVWTQNPATTQPWQQSDLQGLEAGLLSK